ncbi:MAG: ABC-2 family transporter protein [Chloroflexi bacterium ADurb.Bin325]|nr:MAG: ABC-2 family transporter protein [Chloroflexi bacterium ADurb.Bin325]
MRNIRLVIKHEILTTLGRPSFWFMTFLFPAMIMGFSLLPTLMAETAFDNPSALPSIMQAAARPIGYVDQGGFIRRLPPDVPADSVRAFVDEDAALAALAAGEISQYYVLPADLPRTGRAAVVADQAAPLSGITPGRTIEYLIDYNLTGDDRLARLVLDPLGSPEAEALSPDVRAGSGASGFTISFAVMFVLFFVITMSAGYMLQSVAKEKENRTAEVLLMSVRPRELMLGKVLGLGFVALVQMGVWGGGGVLLMGSGLAIASMLAGHPLPLSLFFWAFAYFVLGYLIYAAMLGALGALAPTMREGSQFTFVLLIPLIMPMWFSSVFMQEPNGVMATVLSLFPLTAPTSMVTRMAATAVPLWQPVVGILLLLAATYLLVLLSARFFRADTLLSSDSLSWGRIRRELLGKAR